MLSQTARYAMSILGHLARNPGERVRSEEIARATGIPVNYLSKILNQLRKQGVVDSEKGWGGGFRLRDGAGKLPIRSILVIFDGIESTDPKGCLFGLESCDSENPCPLHPYWERIREAHAEMLDGTTVQDLAGEGPT